MSEIPGFLELSSTRIRAKTKTTFGRAALQGNNHTNNQAILEVFSFVPGVAPSDRR